jgi:hypothetical protein
MPRKPRTKLTEADWQRVFKLRCRSKSGIEQTPEEMAFCHGAARQDPERYNAMDKEVFEATKPFGA